MNRHILTIFLVANIFIVEMCCHPSPDQVQQPNAEKLIDVQDTDDEFVIKKPQQVNQPQYKEFLDTLYRQDSVKNSDKKTKRETADELPVEDAMEYVIPEKPKSGVDENYDKFISNLYSQDTEKHVSQQSNLHRQKRALIFRPLFVYKQSELKKQNKEKLREYQNRASRRANPNQV